MQNLRKLVVTDQTVILSDKMGSHVKTIGNCSLTLNNDFIMILKITFYVPSYLQNLFSVSKHVF